MPTDQPDMPTTIVPPDMHGQRLDAALALLLPDTGMRQRRRCFETHEILVNGIPRPKGFCVAHGDELRLVPRPAPDRPSGTTPPVSILCATPHFAAVYKPGGMHTAHIAGGPDDSLEMLLPSLFPQAEDTPILVNRLDRLTSGMVIVAFGQEQADLFRQLEDSGGVEKLYLAVVHGKLATPCNLDNVLDTAKRKTTRVLDMPNGDALRHTAILPLGGVSLPGRADSFTLVLASIHKGARHQIRAHLSHAGFPIAGDPLYGPEPAPDMPLFLHHYHIEFADITATCPPPPSWTEWDAWQREGLVLLPRQA